MTKIWVCPGCRANLTGWVGSLSESEPLCPECGVPLHVESVASAAEDVDFQLGCAWGGAIALILFFSLVGAVGETKAMGAGLIVAIVVSIAVVVKRTRRRRRRHEESERGGLGRFN